MKKRRKKLKGKIMVDRNTKEKVKNMYNSNHSKS